MFFFSLFFFFLLSVGLQVAESSPVKQFLFKRSLQTAHRRRMLVEAEKPVGPALELQHRLLDKVPPHLDVCFQASVSCSS